MLAACARPAPEEAVWTPRPVAEQARVVVLTPNRRVQAVARWRIRDACCGRIELVHPASGRSVALAWRGDEERVRTDADAGWRALDAAARARLGLPGPLAGLAGFLAGHPPPGARRTPDGWVWDAPDGRVFVRVLAGGRGLAFENPARGISARVFVR